MEWLDVAVLQLFNGISVGSLLLLAALGLAITFGVMGVINMAHGQFIMIGGYVAYTVEQTFLALTGAVHPEIAFPLALPLSFVVCALLGMALEWGLVRHLYQRTLDTLLATFGVGLVLQQGVRDIFGAPNVNVSAPSWLDGRVVVGGGLALPDARLFILGLALLALGAVSLYLYRLPRGRRIRAVIQNREMAACLGVATGAVDREAFALGTGLAGLAGCALCLVGPIGPFVGNDYIVDTFLVVITGGVGQLIGTVVASALIGTLDAVFTFLTTASLGKVFLFLAIILFLQWRPRGLVTLRAR
ncbi:MAG: urea ABC transporter permease subunit UrtB [Chloroflexi bacterium]|nr:urea ABC transporter permease subunit UrtB [Chloroflexota bacterium]